MNSVLSEKLVDTLKVNTDKLSNLINLSTFESIYNYIRSFVVDNLIFITIAYIFILPFIVRNFGFNFITILIPPLLLIVYNVVKITLRTRFQFFNKLRANECLNNINHVIINNTVRPIETKPALLSKPLHEFIINTTHNTYAPCNQNGDIASTEAIKRALKMGARVIELDMFAKNSGGKTDDDFTPVVAHGVQKPTGDIFTTNYILFEDCIKTLATFGLLTSDPLFIVLEINTNQMRQVQQKLKAIILKYFGNNLLGASYKMNSPNRKYFINEPIGNLLNKVIFIGDGGKTEELDSVLDGIWGETNFKNMDASDTVLKKTNEKGAFSRVYPSGNVYGHFSQNFDPAPLWNNRYNLLAMNSQTLDENLMKNVAMFKNNSFVHFSEL